MLTRSRNCLPFELARLRPRSKTCRSMNDAVAKNSVNSPISKAPLSSSRTEPCYGNRSCNWYSSQYTTKVQSIFKFCLRNNCSILFALDELEYVPAVQNTYRVLRRCHTFWAPEVRGTLVRNGAVIDIDVLDRATGVTR